MKRIISAALSAAILLSLSGISALAAIPAAPAPVGTASSVISETYTGDTATYFGVNYSNSGKNVTQNTTETTVTIADGVVTIKNPSNLNSTDTFHSDVNYAGVQLITSGTNNTLSTRALDSADSTKVLPENWMAEFDAKAVNNNVSLNIITRTVSQDRIYISPDVFEVGTWYTFRVYARDDFSSSTNRATALADSVAIYMIERDNSSAVGRWLVSGTDFKVNYSTYGRQSCNAVFGFGMCAVYNKVWLKTGVTDESLKVNYTSGGTAKTVDISTAAMDAEYQLDNITIYSQPALQDSYELYEGIITERNYEELAEGAVLTNNKPCAAVVREGADNKAVKITVPWDSTNLKPLTTGVAVAADMSSADTDRLMNDGFVVDVDLCNTVPGYGMMLSIAGALSDVYDENASRYKVCGRMLTFRSHDDDLGKWYTYRIVCTPNAETASTMDVDVYRRLTANTNAPFVKVEKGEVYQLGTVCGDGGEGNAYKIKTVYYSTNQLSYYGDDRTTTDDDVKNKDSVWLMDNLQVFDKAAYSGNVTSDASSVTAELNVATATNGSTAIVAVYDGTKLVDVNYANVSSVGGKVRVKCDTAPADKTVKLYIWDGLGTAKPLLKEAKPLADFLD